MIDRLRVVSYNIHRGLSPFRKIEVLDNIAAVLLSSKADILCLQEDVYSDVVTASEVEHRCRTVWQNAVYGETIMAPAGSQGNTILSHFPISKTENYDISASCGEARRLLAADISLGPHDKLKVFCTHFGLWRKQRIEQLRRLGQSFHLAVKPDERVILAGDFNDWRHELTPVFRRRLGLHESFQVLRGQHAKSFPAVYPMLSLDRIYYRNLVPVQAKVLRHFGWRGRSDHLPIMVDFHLTGKDYAGGSPQPPARQRQGG
jgi:endonuclease/exonuclease/phosphatase family metal-dependent hydrolase